MIVAAAVAALALAATGSDLPDAPLGLRTQGTFRELFLDPVLSDARPARRAALDLRWSFANDWSTPTIVRRGGDLAVLQADEQSDSVSVALRAPWGPATIGAEWRLTQHWGGWSDPVIETWHRVLHVYNYERLAYPRNAVTVRLGAASGPRAIDFATPRLAWGDLVLRAQLPIMRGGLAEGDPGGPDDTGRDRWAVALRWDVKVPTGRVADAGGSGGWDGSTGLAASAELSPRLTVHSMASATVVSDLPRAALVQPRRWQLGADLSLALRLGAWTVLAEDRLRSALLEGGWRYEGKREPRRGSAFMGAFRPQNQVSLGVRRGAFSAWFSEDFTPGGGDPAQGFYYLSNAPDFVLGVAFTFAL